jgi:hypothetical protein
LAATALLLVSGVAATTLSSVPNASAAPVTRYVFTAFTNSSESNMYVYTSTDARDFSLLRGPAYTPPSGLIRDPSIMKHTDGRYYVVYTVNWTGTQFGIAASTDLLNWTFVRNVPVPLSGIHNTWAPEWFVDPADGSVNVIVSLSTGSYGPFRPYRMRALNAALSSWTTPVALGGFTTNHIDTFIVRSGSTYHAFAKNETTKYIEHATAPSLNGPYTFVGTGNWSGWGSGLEGIALTQLDNGTWRIFMDAYSSRRYWYADSGNLNSWTARVEVPGGLSGFIRHGTILKETVETGPPGAAFTSTAVAQHSGKCLDVPNATTTTGTQLQQWTCNGLAAQNFQFRPVAGSADTYTVANAGNGLCLDVAARSIADGALVTQWTCTGSANQSFRLRSTGSGVYQLVAAHSGKCVDVTGAGTADGAKTVQWTCSSGANQRWRLAGRPA